MLQANRAKDALYIFLTGILWGMMMFFILEEWGNSRDKKNAIYEDGYTDGHNEAMRAYAKANEELEK